MLSWMRIVQQYSSIYPTSFSDLCCRALSWTEGRRTRSISGRSKRLCRMWTLRNRSCYLTSWQDRRPWQRNLLPKRNGRNGTDNKETLRDTYRHPDGTHRSSGRLDQSYRIRFIVSDIRQGTGRCPVPCFFVCISL